MIINFIVYFLF